MNLRIATYNVNNLFERASVMQLDGFSPDGAGVLQDVQRLDGLLEKNSYKGAVGAEIVGLLEKYEFHKPKKNRWFTINEVRKKLFSVKQDGTGVTLVAAGRKSWLGWVELIRDSVHEASTENTARVIQAVKAHILCVVEVEDRLALDRFNKSLLTALQADYPHNLLIDGNDDRGIDVGLLSQFAIRSVRSHIDDVFPNKAGHKVLKFSRDCPEYEVVLPQGQSLWMLCNHLKSKGYGNQADNNDKRAGQANRIREILGRFDLTQDFVVVAGDLNDTPDSAPLKGLLQTPNLFDVLASPKLQGPRWTYQDGKDQIDYLLVSKALHDKLQKVGIERHGIFRADNFNGQFPHFPQVTDKVTQASDHAAVWADFKL
ncbi:MAG: endonuclease/exonuclease/phosphatase family protein [Deltaproteobacteria bacterium]|nr:endonuclease/exonuclease/phosphatase family protein [Deltaproteobacteria bacterium]